MMRTSLTWLSVLLVLSACSSPPKSSTEPVAPTGANLRGRTLIVDAGHGGDQPGAVAVDGTLEKDVNRRIADRLRAELQSRGAQVIESRPGDRSVSLDERAALADRVSCDLFVSVHADASTSTSPNGATVYIARGAYPTSRSVGGAIEARLSQAGLVSRGVREAGFRVLMGHNRPSVLVECGFLTNPGDRALLLTPDHQDRVARAIADGITDILGQR